MQIFIISWLRYPGLQSHWKLPGVFLQVPFPHTPRMISHSSMSVQKKKERRKKKSLGTRERKIQIELNRFDSILERISEKNGLTVTFNPVFVQRETLVTLATETSNRVLASTVQAHPGKLDALVHVLLVRETAPPRAQFFVRVGPWLRARFASLATPRTSHGTAAQAL